MATQTRAAEAPEQEPDAEFAFREGGRNRRLQAAQIVAFVALVAALVGALGPAQPIRTTYSWPPPALPKGNLARLWYAPLLLVNRAPESLHARLPCSLPAALPGAGRATTVLATARYPANANGLDLERIGRVLSVRIGARVLDRVPLSRHGSTGAGCAYRLDIANGVWSLAGGPSSRTNGGTLDQLPVVDGLFSTLNLRAPNRPTVEVVVVPESARPILRQTIAWVVAGVSALAALLLISLQPRALRRRGRRGALGRTLRAVRPLDGAIALLLAAWWILSPAFDDDGWVLTRQRMFASSGGFSNYFDSLGANLPLGYWLEWLQHWVADATTSLVLLRVPALVCLTATWVLCRWILASVLGPGAGRQGVLLWVLGAMFVVVGFSWGMTLRPEPVVALLVAGVLACTIRFLQRQSVAALALGVVLVVLAVTAHPAGVVAIAPLLAAAPTVVRWARSHAAVAATIVPAALVLLLMLGTIGSDASHRSSDAAAVRSFGDTQSQGELWRYQALSFPRYGAGLRRASVALMLLVLLIYLFRAYRGGDRMRGLATRSLALGLALLVLTPSKWPWHFGTLLALAAVAAAAETSRLVDDPDVPEATPRRRALPFLWIGGAGAVAAWSWTPRLPWDWFDLRTLNWTLGVESVVPFSKLAVLLPLLVLSIAIIVALARGRRNMWEVPRSVAVWSVSLVAAPLVVFTIAVLAADTAKTPSWTLARQNLDALRGDRGCGLGDHLVGADLGSVRPLSQVAPSPSAMSVPAWVPTAPVAGLRRFGLGPVASGSAHTPWFAADAHGSPGVLVAGPAAQDTKLRLDFARIERGRVERLGREPFVTTPVEPTAQDVATWRFLAPAASPSAARRANAVRVSLQGDGTIGEAVAVTSPVTYASKPLNRTLESGPATLTGAFILPYFPCAREPRLSGGAVSAPQSMLLFAAGSDPALQPLAGTFAGVTDLYSFTRLPLVDPSLLRTGSVGDSSILPQTLALFRATPISGAKVALPVASSSG